MRENSCQECGNRKGAIKFTAFGYEYIMYTNLCQDCWENQVKKDALRLRAQFNSPCNDVLLSVHNKE